MKKSLLVLGLIAFIVLSVVLFMERTSTSDGLRVVNADELSTLKDQPVGPILIRYSSSQWEEITKDIPTIDGPLPRTGGQLGFIFDFEPDDFPPKNILAQPRCPSPKPGYVCTPNFTFGPRDELIFAGCTCFPPPKEGEEDKPPESEDRPSVCPMVFGGPKLLYCQGSCTGADGCTDNTCVTVQSAEFPGMLECDCVSPEVSVTPVRPTPP